MIHNGKMDIIFIQLNMEINKLIVDMENLKYCQNIYLNNIHQYYKKYYHQKKQDLNILKVMFKKIKLF